MLLSEFSALCVTLGQEEALKERLDGGKGCREKHQLEFFFEPSGACGISSHCSQGACRTHGFVITAQLTQKKVLAESSRSNQCSASKI